MGGRGLLWSMRGRVQRLALPPTTCQELLHVRPVPSGGCQERSASSGDVRTLAITSRDILRFPTHAGFSARAALPQGERC